MKKKILVKGPVLTQSGYGEQARFALRALRSQPENFDIYIQPITWGTTGWLSGDNEFRNWMDKKIIDTQMLARNNALQVDMTLQITIPSEFEKMAKIDIGYTAGIETTMVSPQWLAKGNQLDKILVVSKHAKESYQRTKGTATNNQTGDTTELRIETPIDVVHETTPRAEPEEIIGFEPETDFNFLCVSQWSTRKNFENTIKWWVEEFIDKKVGLVIKTNTSKNSLMDCEFTNNRLTELLKDYKDRKCKVYLLHGDLTQGQMTGLYRHEKIKCLINIAHGEGFGLPMFEAAREELPIITHGFSGHTDFLRHSNKAFYEEVKFDMKNIQQEAVWENILIKESHWAYADQGSYKMALRRVHKSWNSKKKRAVALKKIIDEKFNEEKLFKGFCDSILGKSKSEPRPIESISFCIPTNGAKPEKTKLTVESIKKEMADMPYEIIMAGDIENFKNIDGVTLIDKKEEAHSRKVSVLRNTAAKNSKFDTLVWCDDDMVLGDGWREKVVEFSQENGWDVLGCKLLNPDGTRHWDRKVLSPTAHHLVEYSHPSYDRNLMQTSGFMMVRKEVFDSVKWDESSLVYADRIENKVPEDVIFSRDLHAAGYGFHFCEEATTWHNDDKYTEFNNLTLLKDVVTENYNIDFFPPPCRAFKEAINK